MTPLRRSHPQGNGQVGFAGSRFPKTKDRLGCLDVPSLGQLTNQNFRKMRGSTEVETLQGLDLRKPGFLDPTCRSALDPLATLGLQQLLQEPQMAQSLAGGFHR